MSQYLYQDLISRVQAAKVQRQQQLQSYAERNMLLAAPIEHEMIQHNIWAFSVDVPKTGWFGSWFTRLYWVIRLRDQWKPNHVYNFSLWREAYRMETIDLPPFGVPTDCVRVNLDTQEAFAVLTYLSTSSTSISRTGRR